jgi:hypothetical protein
MDHEQAMQAAIDRVANTMGDYSRANAAPVFNTQLGRMALQFKKFGQKTYYLLGKTALQSFTGENKVENMKAFAGLMATHGLLAGALGLPLEAIHGGMLAAQLIGVSPYNYGDFEQAIRGIAARNLGPGWGEIATRGLPRYMGVDVSSRFSLADLIFPLGDPKSLKPADLLTYAAKAFGGAPLSLILEYPGAIQKLMQGDVVGASGTLVPIKLYSDAVQGYQRASVGRQTAGGRQIMTPYTPAEQAIKTIGFAPAREAETMEAYGAQYGDLQAFNAQRGKLIQNMATAQPSDIASSWKKIIEWNAGQPPAAQIQMRDVEQARHRRERETGRENLRGGLRTNERSAHIREQSAYYNIQ